MSLSRRWLQVLLVVFLMGASFAGGYWIRPSVPFSEEGRSIPPFSVVLASLPGAQERGLLSGKVDSASLSVFWEALYHVKQKYVDPVQDDKKLVYGAIRGMLATLDPYTRFMEPSDYEEFLTENQGEFQGIGALLGVEKDTRRIVIISVFEKNPAAEAGLKPGDYIVAIDGVPTEGMSLEAAVARIKGPAGTPVTLKVQRRRLAEEASRFKLLLVPPEDESPKDLRCPQCQQRLRLVEEESEFEELEIPITRGHVAIPILERRMLPGHIGYLWLKMFNDRARQEIEKAVRELAGQGLRGLILDLRHNPGGLLDMAVQVAGQFVPGGKPIVYIKERDKEPEPISADPGAYLGLKVPLVVLVDHHSASASEIVAGALQDYGVAPVVGEKTYGKGLVQTVIPLSDKSALVVTTAKYLTPKHRDIDKDGIAPDVEVSLPPYFDTRKLGTEKDPQVQKALEVLQRQALPAVATGQPSGR